MGFMPCSDQHDPFTKKVRSVYRAGVVRAPRTGIDPLDALAVRKTVVEQRGRLARMIAGDPPALPDPSHDEVAELRGQHSTAVDVGLGLDLTTKFLAALGLPIPSASVTGTLWKGAHQVEFEVRDVTQHQIDLSELGQALTGRHIVRNPATDVFFSDEKTRLMVITRTLMSSSFAVHAVRQGGQSLEVRVDALADFLGETHANAAWSLEGESTLSFRGTTAATFAFAAVPCAIAEDGTFIFGLEFADATMGDRPVPEPVMRPVFDTAGLLTFDSDDSGQAVSA
jgi:hypothetical protein